MANQRSISSIRQDRLDGILQSLLDDESASPQSLAAKFDVSLMTIHRDLDELQRRGVVRKFHGGVNVKRTSNFEIAAVLRRQIAVPQKQAIGAAAAELITPGSTIMLDDSTTVSEMLPHLSHIEELRVVTNYLPVINHLVANSHASVRALGGDYDQSHESFLGVGAVNAVSALRVDTVFVSTTSADVSGLFHQEEKIVALKSEMLRCAAHRVLLMDSTKLGPTSLHRVCGWDAVDELFIDDGAPLELLESIAAQRVAIRTVAASST